MPELDPFAIPDTPTIGNAPVAVAPGAAEPVAVAPGAAEPGAAEPGVAEPGAEGAEAPTVDEPAVPAVVDEVLVASVELAREALLEITPASTIGAPAGHIVEGEHMLALLFECTMSGYPGWYWTVSMARVDGDAPPSVLETELMPGDAALLAPDWVPWSERLAEYQASQETARAGRAAEADDDTDDLDEDDDLDDEDDDLDDDDLDDERDGVDIDALHDGDEAGDDIEDVHGDDLDDDGEEFEAADITGVELATLELEDDETENAEGASGDSRPDQPAGVAGEHVANEYGAGEHVADED